MNPLDLESLLAAIGVDKVLEAKPTLHKYQVLEAAKAPQTMRAQILKFLATDDFEPSADPPDFDYDELKAQLSQGVTTEQQAALAQAVGDPEMAQELGTEASRIVNWANTVLPRETRDSIRGPIDETPPAAALGDFARIWLVAVHPMAALDELAEGELSDDQVAALAISWPALYGEMRQAVSDSIATMNGRRKTWEPSSAKAAQLDTLMQRDSFDAALAGAMQAVYAVPPAPPPAAPKAPTSDDIDANETPGQRAATS
jgi:hypothetical protein